jgi:hypothetical protein
MRIRSNVSTINCRCSVGILRNTVQRRNSWSNAKDVRMHAKETHGHAERMQEKSRMHQRAIEAYSDLNKRSAARYAEYEASIKLREETES